MGVAPRPEWRSWGYWRSGASMNPSERPSESRLRDTPMSVPACAGFIAEFPDDMVEEERDIAVFGGRNVAMALGEILKSLGCDDVSTPAYDGENGWVFTLNYGRRQSFFCQVTSLHPAFWLLFEGSGGNAEVRKELWLKFSTALENDPRFHSIIWRSKQDGPPEIEEIGDKKIRQAVLRIPPEPIAEEFRPPKRRQSRVTPLHYAFALFVGLAVSIPFAAVFGFGAMLMYLGAWWGIFGVVAAAVAWWFYIGHHIRDLLRPLPR
jgi:hypothetical protein